jgi:hypothetical protein
MTNVKDDKLVYSVWEKPAIGDDQPTRITINNRKRNVEEAERLGWTRVTRGRKPSKSADDTDGEK